MIARASGCADARPVGAIRTLAHCARRDEELNSRERTGPCEGSAGQRAQAEDRKVIEALTPLLAGLEASGIAQAVRTSRWTYAAVNGTHVLGIALLVGAIVPLDLRLLGLWRRIDHVMLSRVLVPMAAGGLVLAACTGVLLFSVRAQRYATYDIVALKLSLVLIGALLALVFHLRAGLWLDRATVRQAQFHGAASVVCWLGAIACGRMIAYVG